MYEAYLWIVIVGGILMSIMGFGIGANDVANNFGSSVGSGAIKLWKAVVLAAIFEFLGAVGLGSSVTSTVRSGILDIEYFRTMPDILMYGNLCALAGATIWLLSATRFGLPVSTTHSIIGALLGFGIATGIPQAIDWMGVLTVVSSWFISPVLAGCFGGTFFFLLRLGVLRREEPVKILYRTLWLFLFIVCFVFITFFMFKNPMQLNLTCGIPGSDGAMVDTNPCPLAKWVSGNPGLGIALSLGLAAGVTLLLTPFAYYQANQTMKTYDTSKDEAVAGDVDLENADSAPSDDTGERMTTESATVAKLERSMDISLQTVPSTNDLKQTIGCNATDLRRTWESMPWFQDLVDDALEEDEGAAKIHDQAEKFDPRAEEFFKFLQVISAISSCLTHGANDVANAVAPFATIYGIYVDGYVADEVSTPVWILATGGLAISLGLGIYGYRVIKSVGVKLTKITPSRGFCIETGMTTMMVIGSSMGLPLSTTHAQVGSTVGVGLIDKRPEDPEEEPVCEFAGLNWDGVNWKLVGRIAVSWVATLLVAGTISGTLFAFGAWGPTLSPLYAPVDPVA